jgi:hypothetical protein
VYILFLHATWDLLLLSKFFFSKCFFQPVSEVGSISVIKDVKCKTYYVEFFETGTEISPIKLTQGETALSLVHLFSSGAAAPRGAMACSFMRFLDHTQRHSTVCRTFLDE